MWAACHRTAQDALRAISKLDGYGYDNLILSVSMAAPRPERA